MSSTRSDRTLIRCTACGQYFITGEGFARHSCVSDPPILGEIIEEEEKKKGGEEVKLEDIEAIARTAKVGSQELPDQFVATVTKIEKGVDEEYDRPCVLVDLDLGEGIITTVKWTPFHLKAVAKNLKAMGIEELREGQKYLFKKQSFGIGFPRPVPVEKR
jgi:hypothetical protein